MSQHCRSAKKITVLALAVGALSVASTVSLQAVPLGLSRGLKLFHPEGEMAKVPKRWTQFCRERPAECRLEAHEPRVPELTEARMAELERINKEVNRSIKPRTDLRNYGVSEKWTYPDNGYGDCEDYALLKRRKLIELGWPREALLVTVVWSGNEGHSVLTAHTDSGDYVLDNQNSRVLLWTKTRYDYVKRQSRYNQNEWVYIDGQGPTNITLVAAAKKTRSEPQAPQIEKQKVASIVGEKATEALAGMGLQYDQAVVWW